MIAAIVWTIVFVGGDLLALVWLLWYAIHKDREKLRQAAE